MFHINTYARVRIAPLRAALALLCVCLISAGWPAYAREGGNDSGPDTSGLRTIIAQIPVSVAEKLPADALLALPALGDKPSLDDYLAHMLAVHLHATGRRVRRASQPLPSAEPAPEQLPECYVELLTRSGVKRFLLPRISQANPETLSQLELHLYAVPGGHRLEQLHYQVSVPAPLEALRSPQEPRGARTGDWLVLLRTLFENGAGAAAPREMFKRAHAAYMMRAGQWEQAAAAYASLTGGEPQQAFMHRTVCLELAGRTEKAREALAEAIKAQPDSGPLYALQAWLVLQGPRPEDALALIEQARRSDMTREGLYVYAHGLISLAVDDHQTAEQDFIEAARQLPEHAFAQVRVARIHRAAGRTELALRAYRAAAEAAGPNAQVWAELALALEGADQLNGAVGTLRRAYQQNPANAHVAYSLAGLLTRQGNHDAALEVLAGAAEAASCNADMHAAHGDLAATMWRLEEAARAYRRAMRTASGGHTAAVKLARVRRLRRDYNEAEALMDEALESYPENGDLRAAVLMERAALLTEVGSHERAVELLEAASRLPGAQLHATLQRVDTYLAMETTEAEKAALRQAQLAVATGENSRSLAALAQALLATGAPDKGLTAARAALEKSPSCSYALRAATRVHLALENLDQAAATARRALDVNPYDVVALQWAGRVELLSGRPENCAELWRRALELNPWNAALHSLLADVLSEQLNDREAAVEHIEKSAELRKRKEAYLSN